MFTLGNIVPEITTWIHKQWNKLVIFTRIYHHICATWEPWLLSDFSQQWQVYPRWSNTAWACMITRPTLSAHEVCTGRICILTVLLATIVSTAWGGCFRSPFDLTNSYIASWNTYWLHNVHIMLDFWQLNV